MIPSEFERPLMGVAALLYGLALAVAVRRVATTRSYPRPWVLGVVAAGFLIQTLALHSRGLRAGGCPVGNGFEILQFVAWAFVLVYLLVGTTFRLSLLGLFASGLAAILAGGSLLVPAWDASRSTPVFGGDPWVESHAALALLAYGVFGLNALVGGMHLLQHAALKARRPGRFGDLLPSVVQLDRIGRNLLLVATGMLTAALGVAALGWTRADLELPVFKFVAVLLVWCAAVGLVYLRWRRRVVGPTFARAAILLFVGALLSLWPVEGAIGNVAPRESAPSLPQP